ncbi:hypothetical protein CEXT_247281 [Caerostris extrusa]|uniref:Uncharacterized protein n=1 Tax=Caerostris extrusa TaxID=172846 RepID=A0AAV4MFV7_CAEEX|nr:hypothetical protein CEXT_247281 [Caerostris extrusa]
MANDLKFKWRMTSMNTCSILIRLACNSAGHDVLQLVTKKMLLWTFFPHCGGTSVFIRGNVEFVSMYLPFMTSSQNGQQYNNKIPIIMKTKHLAHSILIRKRGNATFLID